MPALPVAVSQAASSTTSSGSATLAARLPAMIVLALGLIILYSVGFSPFTRAHNAAHDTRHANGFPCH